MGPEEQVPLAPYQGRGWCPAHERGRVCLPIGGIDKEAASPAAWGPCDVHTSTVCRLGVLAHLDMPLGSVGSTLSKATLLRLPESVNKLS